MPIDWFRAILQKETPAPPPGETEAVRAIAEKLDRLSPNRARFVAAFAYLLARIARADSTVSEEETARMRELLVERGHLAADQAALVVDLAKTQHLDSAGVEDFMVAREFSRLATRDERLALIDCLYAVSAANGTIRTVEDNEIRRVAREIRVEHGDFITIRSAYRARLAVLQLPGEGEP